MAKIRKIALVVCFLLLAAAAFVSTPCFAQNATPNLGLIMPFYDKLGPTHALDADMGIIDALFGPSGFPGPVKLATSTVASLPAPTMPNMYVTVTDGTTSSDCTTGGATGGSAFRVLCRSNGSAWEAAGSGGGTGLSSLSANVQTFLAAANFAAMLADLGGVPYTGATGPVNLGSQNFTTTGQVNAGSVGVGTTSPYTLPTAAPAQDGEILTSTAAGSGAWTPQFTGLQIFLDTSTSTPTALGQTTFTIADDFLHVGDGTNTWSFVPQGKANSGLILGAGAYTTTSGALWYANHVYFYNGSASTQLFDANAAVSLYTGSTAVTQTTGDTSTDVATDAFVANAISGIVFPSSGIQPVQETASFTASALYEYLINASSGINVTLPPALGASGPIGIRNLSANQIDLVPKNALTTIETAMGTSNTAGHQIKCTGATCSGTLYSLANAWYWQPISGTWTDDGPVTGGTPTFVQAPPYCHDNWGPACTAESFASNVTAGDTLFVFASGSQISNTAVTISDTLGNTWKQVMFAPQTCNGSSCTTANQTTGLWVAYQAKGGADTVNVTWGAGASSVNGSGLGIAEFANVSRTDGTPAFAASASGTTATSPSLTTTNAKDLVIGILGGGQANGGSTTPTVGSGYTLLGSYGYTGGNGWEYQIVSSTGTYTASFGIASGTPWDAGIAAFANF